MKKWVLFSFITVLTFACKDASESTPIEELSVSDFVNIDLENLPNYEVSYPVHYTNAVLQVNNIPANNSITNAGASLGRVLFYDKNLSRTNTISCASCHKQEEGFSDKRTLSLGIDGVSETGAHSMRLGNTVFYSGNSMFWDKRATSVEDQVTKPIKDAVEMGFDSEHGGMGAVISKIQELPYYPILFKHVFGDETITEERMQKALAQFVRSMISVNSKYDSGFASVFNPALPGNGENTDFPNFTAQENRGKLLFTSPPNAGGFGCAGCHRPPTFALEPNSRSNGLDAGETVIFKSPSLKNLDLDGGYMHDGRFSSLEEVVQHYSNGIVNGPALDNRLKNPQGNGPLRLNISTADAAALVAFMKTLTDTSLSTDTKFSDPFLD